MSATDTYPRGDRSWRTRRCGPFRSWHPAEILAMVAGFAIWWPLGLAVIGYKVAQRKGLPVPDLYAMARERFSDTARGFKSDDRRRWRPFDNSGNAAFDEWRAAELAKLDEERRKLDDAEREFAAHLDGLRRARDRDEFDRFMASRSTRVKD